MHWRCFRHRYVASSIAGGQISGSASASLAQGVEAYAPALFVKEVRILCATSSSCRRPALAHQQHLKCWVWGDCSLGSRAHQQHHTRTRFRQLPVQRMADAKHSNELLIWCTGAITAVLLLIALIPRQHTAKHTRFAQFFLGPAVCRRTQVRRLLAI
jgi:hypothetical protein